MVKKKIGLAVFILLCLTVCYMVDRSNEYNFSPKTYGEYQEQQESIVTNAIARTTVSDQKALEENQKALEDAEDKQELVKRAYLTFDDGPSENTPLILEILKKYNIKATFFVIAGEITPEREALIRQMIAEGHVVGVHTYSHKQKQIYANKEACVSDIKKAYDRMIEITGVTPIYYRFPYGSANCYISGFCNAVIRDLDDMGLTYIDWNIDSKDSIGTPPATTVIKNISKFDKYIEPVLLFHDGRGNNVTPKVLPQIIEKIKAAGYEFGTIADRSKPYQWSHNWQKE